MSSTAGNTRTRRLGRRAIWLTGTLLLIGVLLLLLVPVALKYYLSDWLVDNGAEKATIESVRFNPFVGRLQLEGLDVSAGGRDLLQNGTMVIDLGIGALFDKDIRLQTAVYKGLMIDMEHYADGSIRLGTYTIGSGSSEEVRQVEPQQVAKRAWAVLADEVVLTDCRLYYSSPELDLTLEIDQAELRRFGTREESPGATFNLQGRLNGSAVTVHLEKLKISPSLDLEGSLGLEAFDLDSLGRLVAEALPTFAGQAGIEGDFAYHLEYEGGMTARFTGDINLQDSSVGSADFLTSAKGLKYSGKAAYTMEKSGAMQVSTEGQLTGAGNGFTLSTAELKVHSEKIEYGGSTLVTIGPEIEVEHEGVLTIGMTTVGVGGQEVGHDNLYWQGQTRYGSNLEDSGNAVRANGRLEVSGGGYSADGVATGAAESVWQGEVFFRENPGRVATLGVNGTLDAQQLQLDTATVAIGLGGSTLQADMLLELDEAFGLTGEAKAQANGFALSSEESGFGMSLEHLRLNSLQATGGAQLKLAEMRTELLAVNLPGALPLQLSVPEISLTDLATSDRTAFSFASVHLGAPELRSEKNGRSLLAVKELGLQDGKAELSGAVQLGQLDITDLSFLAGDGGEPSAVTIASSSVNTLQFSTEKGLAGGKLALDGLGIVLTKNKDGELNIAHRLAAMKKDTATDGKTTEKTPPDEADGQSLPIRLAATRVEGPSYFEFTDYTLAVPFTTRLDIEKLVTGELDTTRPEMKTNIELVGTLDKRAPVELTGTISPFLPQTAVDMDLVLKNYPLSALSPYTVQAVGTGLASGQLQLNSEIGLAEDVLEVDNEILLKKLETERIAEELAQELDNQLPVPLDAALAILRDSDRNISLNIPLGGPLEDLGVDISDVIVTALGKAIVPAASGYLMYTLGPYGALAYVGMKVGEKVLQVSLPPVTFVPGTAIMAEDYTDYLSRVAKILQDRPETDLQLCPQVGVWELEPAQPQQEAQPVAEPVGQPEEREAQLLQLGEQRGEVLQRYLVENHNIKRTRLLVCEPALFEDEKTLPQVLLQL